MFRNNDLPGVLFADAAQRLMRLYGVRPGAGAVVADRERHGYEAALDLLDAGVEVAPIVDLRAARRRRGRRRVRRPAASGRAGCDAWSTPAAGQARLEARGGRPDQRAGVGAEGRRADWTRLRPRRRCAVGQLARRRATSPTASLARRVE